MKRRHYYESVELDNLHLKEIPDAIAMYACHGSYIINNNNLTSLKNAPAFVKGNFLCSFNKLTTLVDGPEEVQGHYYASENNLTSLEGVAKIIGGKLYLQNNRLTSLNGLPKLREGSSLLFGTNRISSLEGYGLENIQFFNFYCEANNLTSLKGSPTRITGNYDCSGNPITSFVGGPIFVSGDFYAGDMTNLISLEGFPKRIGNSVYMDIQDLYKIFPDKGVYDIKNEIRKICKVEGRLFL